MRHDDGLVKFAFDLFKNQHRFPVYVQRTIIAPFKMRVVVQIEIDI